MAEIKLHPDLAGLQTKDPTKYSLYLTLYDGMRDANDCTPPDYSLPPYSVDTGEVWVGPDGNSIPVYEPNQSAIEAKMSEISEIQMRNAAYLFARVIDTASTTAATGVDLTKLVQKIGDSMQGAFSAWYGFDAGLNGKKIFEVTIDSNGKQWAIAYGSLRATENAEINGLLNLGDGIAFGGNKVIYTDSNSLVLEYQNIHLNGDVTIDGTFALGDMNISSLGAFWDGNEFYHAGNSNKSDVDWAMNNGTVYGDLGVKGDASFDGQFSALGGFELGARQKALLYSEVFSSLDDNGYPVNTTQIALDSDLRIINGHGIKFNNDYIVNVRNSNAVSFSAPGMIMNLGDNDNGKTTNKISLQSDIWDYSNTFKIISKEGAGNFPNGLRAQCAVSGSAVIETFRTDTDNLGVLFQKQIRFGATDGPAIYRAPDTGRLNIQIPYINGEVDGHPTEQLSFNTYFAQTDSPFRNQALPWSATLHFYTDAEFFAFDQPVESEYFAIKSDKYSTRLIEDALFFDDGKFIEGVADGLRYSGNGYFDGNISSPSFASGFAGYGWAVKDEKTNGGFHATIDSLTVRKKMRVYELEVQKISCTNGALWVSDFCSGDEVIVLS